MKKRNYILFALAFALMFAIQTTDVCAEQLLLKEGMSGQAVLEMQAQLQ